MIKTVVIPKDNTIHVAIPNNYVGKEVEILLYTKEELTQDAATNNNNASRFKGLLSNEEADKFDTYLKKARSEWDRDI